MERSNSFRATRTSPKNWFLPKRSQSHTLSQRVRPSKDDSDTSYCSGRERREWERSERERSERERRERERRERFVNAKRHSFETAGLRCYSKAFMNNTATVLQPILAIYNTRYPCPSEGWSCKSAYIRRCVLDTAKPNLSSCVEAKSLSNITHAWHSLSTFTSFTATPPNQDLEGIWLCIT